jgi:hypothetical protein
MAAAQSQDQQDNQKNGDNAHGLPFETNVSNVALQGDYFGVGLLAGSLQPGADGWAWHNWVSIDRWTCGGCIKEASGGGGCGHNWGRCTAQADRDRAHQRAIDSFIVRLLLLGDEGGIYGLHSGFVGGLLGDLSNVLGHARSRPTVLEVSSNAEDRDQRDDCSNELDLEFAKRSQWASPG